MKAVVAVIMLWLLAVAAIMVIAPPKARGDDAPPPPPVVVRVATFNALGYSHTDVAGGNATHYRAASTRTRLAVKIFKSWHLDIVALQEFQGPQQRAFRRTIHRTWGLSCRGANCVAWKRAEWTYVRRELLVVPYFHGGPIRTLFVTLRSVKNPLVTLVVTSAHNPANLFGGPTAHWRHVGYKREAARALRVAVQRPIVMMGDRNAKHGSYARYLPRGWRTTTKKGIDFIVPSPSVHVVNAGRVRTKMVRQAADHPLVWSDLALK